VTRATDTDPPISSVPTMFNGVRYRSALERGDVSLRGSASQRCDNGGDNKTVGPGTACDGVTPGPNPYQEGLMAQTMPAAVVDSRQARPDRHWFVPGDDGYCRACNLPVNNGRHAPRKS